MAVTKIISLLRAFLVVLTVMSGQSIAQNVMMPDPTGVMVLCTGTGAVTIVVDSDGQPIDPETVCPDCVTTFTLATELGGLDIIVRAFVPADVDWASHGPGALVSLEGPPARGPPFLIG